MLNILGVNAGNGVMVHPFKNYNLVGNLEPRAIFHSKEERQWYANFDVPIYKSKSECFQKITDVDMIIGHPDCGHSSILSYSRSKALGNPRLKGSLDVFFESIHHYLPGIFIMENLPALLKTFTKDELRDKFNQYELIFIEAPVTKFGNSQKDRVRLLVIGVLKMVKNELGWVKYMGLCRMLSKPYQMTTPKTCRDLLSGLISENPSMGHVREDIDSIITLYAGFKISLRDVKKYWDANKKLKRWRVIDRNFDTAPGVYRNLDGGYPATARKANRQFNSMGLTMSPRELAKIQGVPDSFNIYMDMDNKGYWINKGRASVTKCPPYEIGLWFLDVLKNTIPNLLK